MKNKQKAFTLVEVLITIALLGVIATLAIPALKLSADKVSWAKALAADTNIIKSGFERMLAENEADTLDLTPLWTRVYEEDALFDVMKKELGRYFVLENFDTVENDAYSVYEMGGTEYNGITGNRLKLGNGAIINFSHMPIVENEQCDTIKENGGHLCQAAAYITIDVNGKNMPNTLGKDIYGFFLGNDGLLYPNGGKDANLYKEDSNAPLWDTEEGCQGKTPKHGLSCTARVIEQGYKINY